MLYEFEACMKYAILIKEKKKPFTESVGMSTTRWVSPTPHG